MSSFKVDEITRSAIWQAYGNTCYYCDKFLEWSQLQIDHIIPESIADDLAKFESIKKDYGLGADFNINSIHNFIPAHNTCNQRKTNQLFSITATHFMLELANKKSKTVLELIATEEKRRRSSISLAKISTSLASEVFTEEQLHDVINRAKDQKWNNIPIQIRGGLDYIDQLYKIFEKGGDLDAFYHMPFQEDVGSGKMQNFKIPLINDDDIEVEVGTLAELLEYTNLGFYAIYTPIIGIATALSVVDATLKMLKTIQRPRISYLDDFEISKILLLSPTIIPAATPEEIHELLDFANKGLSVADLVNIGIIEVIDTKSADTILIHYQGFSYYIIDVFRGDLNNDGIEDMFVNVYVGAIEGSMRYSTYLILTRYSPIHLLEPAKFAEAIKDI